MRVLKQNRMCGFGRLIIALVFTFVGSAVRAEKDPPPLFALDRLVNHERKSRCEAKVKGEGKQRPVSFRGFRGRYRLSWKDEKGRNVELFAEVK